MAPSSGEQYMRMALGQARAAGERGEAPVGAVLVSQDGGVLAEAGNSPVARNDPTAHAEILVLRQAALKLGNYRLAGTTMYVTLEPCPMCAGALVHARVKRLVFGSRDLRSGGVRSKFRIADSPVLNHQIEVEEGLLGGECLALLQGFFAARR